MTKNSQFFGVISRSPAQLDRLAMESGIDLSGADVVRLDNGFICCKRGRNYGFLTDSRSYGDLVWGDDGLESLDHIDGLQGKGAKSGCFFVIRPKSDCYELYCDWLGIYPIYYCITPDLFVFGTKLRPLAKSLRADIDHVGVLEFLRNGYCVGDRTMFEGVRRLQPGQKAVFFLNEQRLEISENSPLWNEKFYEESERRTDHEWVEEIWPLLTRSVNGNINGSGKMSLMMSGGWDSRTLLAALDTKSADGGSVYYHGDLASREANIVKKLSEKRQIVRYMQPITDDCLDNQFLNEAFCHTENVVFPHWHFAGKMLKLYDVSIATAGIFGEVLGGHYGISTLSEGVRKAIGIAGELGVPVLAQKSDRLTHDIVKKNFFESINDIPWYWKPDNCPPAKKLETEINIDIGRAFDRLVSRGVTDPIRLVEAFVTEHRGSQYIAHQLLSISPNADINMPFADPQLILQSTCIPSRVKIHNRLNRLILAEKAPGLERYPMAATLVPASAPLLAQELSRVVRKIYEQARWYLYETNRTRYKMPRLSWANFTFLRKSGSLQKVISNLRSPIWKKKVLDDSVSAGMLYKRKGSLHPIFDMSMKIVTVDKTIDSLSSDK